MGVRQRKDTGAWEVSVGTGKNRVRRSFGTKKQADQFHKKVSTELDEARYNGAMGRLPRRLFTDGLLEWLNGEARALKSYDKTLGHARQVRCHLEGCTLQESVEAADRMKSAMLAQGLKPATINQRLAVVRRVLNLAQRWGWVAEPLGQKIKLLPPNNERHIYLAKDQIHELASHCREARDAVLQLAYTGMRVSELYRLSPGDIRDGCIFLDARTKSGKPRVIPLAGAVRNLPIPPVVTRQQLRYRFEQARQEMGMPHLHLHDLRHSTASLLLKIPGVTLFHVRDWLGHSNVSVTSRYAHLARQDLQDAADKM